MFRYQVDDGEWVACDPATQSEVLDDLTRFEVTAIGGMVLARTGLAPIVISSCKETP